MNEKPSKSLSEMINEILSLKNEIDNFDYNAYTQNCVRIELSQEMEELNSFLLNNPKLPDDIAKAVKLRIQQLRDEKLASSNRGKMPPDKVLANKNKELSNLRLSCRRYVLEGLKEYFDPKYLGHPHNVEGDWICILYNVSLLKANHGIHFDDIGFEEPVSRRYTEDMDYFNPIDYDTSSVNGSTCAMVPILLYDVDVNSLAVTFKALHRQKYPTKYNFEINLLENPNLSLSSLIKIIEDDFSKVLEEKQELLNNDVELLICLRKGYLEEQVKIYQDYTSKYEKNSP